MQNSEIAFARVIKLISVRDRSIHELRERLCGEGFDPEIVEATLQRAIDCGLLDDERFAQAYIRGKLHAGWGCARIERELASYGVEASSLAGYPELFFDEDEEIKRAVQELRRLTTTAKNLHEARYRRLASKGYKVAVIQAAVCLVEREDGLPDL